MTEHMDETVSYVEKMRAKGHSDASIRKTLRGAGWSDAQIDTVFDAAGPKQVQDSPDYCALARSLVFDREWVPAARPSQEEEGSQLLAGGEAAIEALAEVILDYRGVDKDVSGRAELCGLIGEIGGRKAISVLRQLREHQTRVGEYEWIRDAADEALAQLSPSASPGTPQDEEEGADEESGADGWVIMDDEPSSSADSTSLTFKRYRHQRRRKVRLDFGDGPEDVPIPDQILDHPAIRKAARDLEEERRRGLCYLTTACADAMGLPDGCFELRALRWFRDERLLPTAAGSMAVEQYYEEAPEVVAAIGQDPEAMRVWRMIYSEIVEAVEMVLSGDYQGAFAHYRRMSEGLKSDFV
ncbi:MAG: CFI-box-CTERM domain-containing protein [Armatimonadota bacterium]|nr:CFI-box-CTERM domain-containing protein [Armatimonadota bacterium]